MDARPDRMRGERDVWGAKLLFGPVVFQVLGTRLAALLDALEMTTPNTHQIWSYRGSFTWRRQPGMDDTTLMGLHDGYLSWLDTLSATQRARRQPPDPGA